MIIGYPIPSWKECANRKEDGHELNALEVLVYEYEPVGHPMTVIQWRNTVALAIAHAVKESKVG